MALRKERWTRIDVPTKVETPRKTYRLNEIFVSPGGLFVETAEEVERGTQITVSFSIEGQEVKAHAELHRCLDRDSAAARGIQNTTQGWEMRLIRMEGDGSQILAEHIKKILLESGGPK